LPVDESNEFVNACSSSAEFYGTLASIFTDVYLASMGYFLENKNWQKFQEIEENWLSKCRTIFETRFREDKFVISLSNAIDCYSKFASTTGLGRSYQNISNLTSLWNNFFIEPLRDTLWRTPSQKFHSEGKFALFHYNPADKRANGKAPVLVIYAFINRHYMLDLLPQVSIIRSLLANGLDIFAADWGTPSSYDLDLTLHHYIHNYLDKSVDKIREHTNSDKVSIFGYCWGGDLAVMYAALYPEKVKNLITVATPGDFSLDDGLLSLWTKRMNVDSLVDTFGNVPSMMLNAAFALRSPIDYIHKIPHFFEKPRDIESIAEFFATEMWLYDSPPVIGEIYRQFVKDCYQDNLLVKNQMKIGSGQTVNLKSIKVPFLNIVAKMDDLVAPNSSRVLNDAVGSNDKSLMEFNSGHVGACISPKAHKELWPKVGEWIASRS
jgi:class III poly(R)-hydroxyalkanoic acid synthase PhaC subunit